MDVCEKNIECSHVVALYTCPVCSCVEIVGIQVTIL